MEYGTSLALWVFVFGTNWHYVKTKLFAYPTPARPSSRPYPSTSVLRESHSQRPHLPLHREASPRPQNSVSRSCMHMLMMLSHCDRSTLSPAALRCVAVASKVGVSISCMHTLMMLRRCDRSTLSSAALRCIVVAAKFES